MDNKQIRNELLWRKDKIRSFTPGRDIHPGLRKLLNEVDAALARLDDGTYGLCLVCHDPVEPERLLADPLTSVCLDHLDEKKQRELEDDITLAKSIQTSMLPLNDTKINGWEIYYHYEPLGAVSGDYCDIVQASQEDDSLYFIIGDVSGKGIAASMLMTHMQAIFRSLIPLNMPVCKLVERASRILCESTSSANYATLLCAKADISGKIEICNAGHSLPLHISQDGITRIPSTGVPIGIFCENNYSTLDFNLNSGDMLLFYTDGLSEAFSGDIMFDMERIEKFAENNKFLSPKEFVVKLRKELSEFLNGSERNDDLTIMAIRKL